MIVVFRRTGERRYSVEAQREGAPDLVRHSAPGYDQFVPHDMMHLVVEAQLGLTRGVFGQLASGGNAGSFIPLKQTGQETARARTRAKSRGAKLMRQGQDELALSERAAYLCWIEWMARSRSSELRNRAHVMALHAAQVKDNATAADRRAMSQSKVDRICGHLDQLSSHWSKLEIGASMSVSWPDLAIVSETGGNICATVASNQALESNSAAVK